MTTEIIIWLVLVAVIGLIIFKITKSIFKAIFLASTIGGIVIFVIGAVVISDVMDFKENFPTQPSIFLLEDQGNIAAGFSGILTEDFQPNYVSNKLGPYDPEDLDTLLGNNYKLFLIKKQAFSSVEEVEGGDIKLTAKEVSDMLASDSPIDDFIEKQGAVPASQLPAVKQNMLTQMNIKNDAEFKGALFASLLGAAIEKEGPLFIFDQYKEGNIIIYPETAMFKFLKRIPASLLENAISTVKRGE